MPGCRLLLLLLWWWCCCWCWWLGSCALLPGGRKEDDAWKEILATACSSPIPSKGCPSPRSRAACLTTREIQGGVVRESSGRGGTVDRRIVCFAELRGSCLAFSSFNQNARVTQSHQPPRQNAKTEIPRIPIALECPLYLTTQSPSHNPTHRKRSIVFVVRAQFPSTIPPFSASSRPGRPS